MKPRLRSRAGDSSVAEASCGLGVFSASHLPLTEKSSAEACGARGKVPRSPSAGLRGLWLGLPLVGAGGTG